MSVNEITIHSPVTFTPTQEVILDPSLSFKSYIHLCWFYFESIWGTWSFLDITATSEVQATTVSCLDDCSGLLRGLPFLLLLLPRPWPQGSQTSLLKWESTPGTSLLTCLQGLPHCIQSGIWTHPAFQSPRRFPCALSSTNAAVTLAGFLFLMHGKPVVLQSSCCSQHRVVSLASDLSSFGCPHLSELCSGVTVLGLFWLPFLRLFSSQSLSSLFCFYFLHITLSEVICLADLLFAFPFREYKIQLLHCCYIPGAWKVPAYNRCLRNICWINVYFHTGF